MTRRGAAGCESCPIAPAADTIDRRDFVRELVARFGVAVFFASGIGSRADKSYAIPASDAVVIDKDESVIIARFGAKVFAFSLACPHQNTALRWDAGNKRFQCPKHRSRYQPDGVFIEGRATRGLDRFAVRRDGESVVVNLDLLYQEDKHPTEWAAAFLPLGEK
jgi:nitrite reductase/ring-hydroxylating ferredoxin subunit